ncbi:MAG: hypothetical protein GY725_13435 [bacterium]|nr:hypothetical protein [bacterium]
MPTPLGRWAACLLVLLPVFTALPVRAARLEDPGTSSRFAREYVWFLDYYLRDDLKLGSDEETRIALSKLLQRATAILQDESRDGDVPCAVRLAAGEVSYYSVGDPRFPRADRARGEIAFPGSFPGVYLAPSPGPSFSLDSRIYVWVKRRWSRLSTSAGWALAHEHGHMAGLQHLDVRGGAPCQLMSYGKLADGCRGMRIAVDFQCKAYRRAAQTIEGTTQCLYEDIKRLYDGLNTVYPAPLWTMCSDGSGYCDGKGLCVAANSKCFTEFGPAPEGTDCSERPGECARCTGDGQTCAEC